MTDYVTLGDSELMQAILLSERQAAEYTKQAKAAKEELLHRKRNAIADAYEAKDSQFGVIHLTADAYDLDITTSAKIDWDQEALAIIDREIRDEWKADPSEYIDRKLSVKESKYKAWPSDLRAKFEHARTIKASAPTISITLKNKD